jgi:hypothetical protein
LKNCPRVLSSRDSDAAPLLLATPVKIFSSPSAVVMTQSEMLERLGFSDELFRSNVSQYERGHGIPPLPVLLQYARIAGIAVETLIDDELDLPAKLPRKPMHQR